jgi:MSHA biogenesis protein MshL
MYNKNMKILPILLILLLSSLAISGCAHQTKITPSTGHLDGNASTMTSGSVAAKTNAADIPAPVKNNVYLPSPKAKVKEPTYSVVVNDVSVKEILFALARESKLNIDIHPDIKGSVTMNAVDQTLPAILERISKQVDMTYKVENNVLTIAPDLPVLKTYQINYVNMQRTTRGGISVNNQIASSPGNTSTSGLTGATGSSVGSNTSSTSVSSISENFFWDTLIQNIKDILKESDKEVLVKRYQHDANLQSYYSGHSQANAEGNGTASAPYPADGAGGNNANGRNARSGNRASAGVSGSGNETLQTDGIALAAKVTEDNRKEYATLYAAAVIANKETGVLSVRATQRQQEKVQEFIDKVQSSAKRQVLIEASIVEITLNDQYQAGIDWSKLSNTGVLDGFTFQQTLTGVGTSLPIAASTPIAIGYSKHNTALGNIAASVKLLQTFGNAKVLSSPKMMVLNSQTAILKVVDNLVYFTIESSIAGGTATSAALQSFTTTPHTIPVGVWMSVTPQVNENGAVTLNVRPTIARKSGDVQDPNPNLAAVGATANSPARAGISSTIPQIQVREMESMLQVNSGNTVILGGLMQDDISNITNGVPGLLDVPVVGNAFKAKNNTVKKTELVIFLRPTVIPNASLESDELQTFKQYLPSQQLQQNFDESAN